MTRACDDNQKDIINLLTIGKIHTTNVNDVEEHPTNICLD